MATPTSGTPKQHQLEEDGERSEHEGSSPDEKVQGQQLARGVPQRQSKGKYRGKRTGKKDGKEEENIDIFFVATSNPTFEELQECAFADKTLFLKYFLTNKCIYRITLPRAMGKTLILKMVESFCQVKPVRGLPKKPTVARKKMWEGTEIRNATDFFGDHFGKHPTIFITLCDVSGDTLEEVLDQFRNTLRETCKKFRYIYDYMKENQEETPLCDFDFLGKALFNPKELDKSKLRASLRTLAGIVKEFHGDKDVVMLMDEYETPVSRLFMKKINKDEMEEIIGFHNDLMISTFKDNPSVSHALMAGILMTGPTGTSTLRNTKDCNLLKCTILNEFFGLTRNDIEEMAAAIYQKNPKNEIPQNVQESVWSWCNGYSYSFGGKQCDFCNPYLCCKFLNGYIEQKKTGQIRLEELKQNHLPINTHVSYLKPLIRTGEIADKLTCIVANFDENAENKTRIQNDLVEEFSLDDYNEFKRAMDDMPLETENKKITRILMAYLFQVGILTGRDGYLVVPNEQTLDQLNDLLLPYYETKYQFSDKIANTVTDALENIAFCDGELDENAFQQPMEKFKESFTNFLIATGHEMESESFPHAMIVFLAKKIKKTRYFIPDREHRCGREVLKIDLAFTLEKNKKRTTVIIEMKHKEINTAETAVKEAIYYRKVYDYIATREAVNFHRFVFIGISVPEPEKFIVKKAITMCYRIENGENAQPEFITPTKFRGNQLHDRRELVDPILPQKGTHYFEVQ